MTWAKPSDFRWRGRIVVMGSLEIYVSFTARTHHILLLEMMKMLCVCYFLSRQLDHSLNKKNRKIIIFLCYFFKSSKSSKISLRPQEREYVELGGSSCHVLWRHRSGRGVSTTHLFARQRGGTIGIRFAEWCCGQHGTPAYHLLQFARRLFNGMVQTVPFMVAA
jgi:hypothetical protein